jgi:hypothetical protein
VSEEIFFFFNIFFNLSLLYIGFNSINVRHVNLPFYVEYYFGQQLNKSETHLKPVG